MKETIMAYQFSDRWYRVVVWAKPYINPLWFGTLTVAQMADTIIDVSRGEIIKTRFPIPLDMSVNWSVFDDTLSAEHNTILMCQLQEIEPRLNGSTWSG